MAGHQTIVDRYCRQLKVQRICFSGWAALELVTAYACGLSFDIDAPSDWAADFAPLGGEEYESCIHLLGVRAALKEILHTIVIAASESVNARTIEIRGGVSGMEESNEHRQRTSRREKL